MGKYQHGVRDICLSELFAYRVWISFYESICFERGCKMWWKYLEKAEVSGCQPPQSDDHVG